MSRKEMNASLLACKLFLDEYEIDGRHNKEGRCRKFFDVIKHIRMCLQVTTELLKRVEQLEDEINNLKLN